MRISYTFYLDISLTFATDGFVGVISSVKAPTNLAKLRAHTFISRIGVYREQGARYPRQIIQYSSNKTTESKGIKKQQGD